MNIEPLHYKWQLGDWRYPSEQGPKVVVRICNSSISVGWGCKRLRVRRCQTRRLDAFILIRARVLQWFHVAVLTTILDSNCWGWLRSPLVILAIWNLVMSIWPLNRFFLFLMFLPLIGIPHFWAFPGVESNAHSARFALFGNWLKTFERGVAAVQQPVKTSKKTG